MVNNKENDKIQKVLKFDAESEKRISSWLAPNHENLVKILNPFQLNSSDNSEKSVTSESALNQDYSSCKHFSFSCKSVLTNSALKKSEMEDSS